MEIPFFKLLFGVGVGMDGAYVAVLNVQGFVQRMGLGFQLALGNILAWYSFASFRSFMGVFPFRILQKQNKKVAKREKNKSGAIRIHGRTNCVR